MPAEPSNQDTSYRAVETVDGYRTVAPLPSPEELADFYSGVYFQQLPTTTYSHEYDDEELAHKRLRAKLILQVARGHLGVHSSQPRLLDIGFGEGFELAAALSDGFVARGVDFGLDGLRRFHPALEDIAEACNPLDALRDFAASAVRFDVCVLKHVLEHVRDPKTVLESVAAILNTDGVAIVTVPDDYSALQAELVRRGAVDREYWFAPPQHLQYFNTENFSGFAAAAGFEIVDLIGDFPIELYLFHPGSNYVRDRDNGPGAHKARVAVDLFLARDGLDRYANVCRALVTGGLSRTMTAYLRLRRG